MKQFHFPKTEYKRQVVDVPATLNSIGEAVTAKTTLLAEIDGHISPGFLPRWISRSPKLESIVLWQGDALASGAGAAIAESCENFRSLTIRGWLSEDADSSFATFLMEMKPDTLAYFEMISFNNLGKMSFEALGHHQNLQHLSLNNLNEAAMRNLNALKGCKSLHTLTLEDSSGNIQLEATENDVFLEVAEWLGSCKQLRDLSLKRFFDGPDLLARVMTSPDLKLSRLSLEGYFVSRKLCSLPDAANPECPIASTYITYLVRSY
jgi:hypothetical protein